MGRFDSLFVRAALLLSVAMLLIYSPTDGSPVTHGMRLVTPIPYRNLSKAYWYRNAGHALRTLLSQVAKMRIARKALNLGTCGAFYDTTRNYSLHTERKNLKFIVKTLLLFRDLASNYTKMQLTAAARKQSRDVVKLTNRFLSVVLKILRIVAGHQVRTYKPAVNPSWLQCQWVARYQFFLMKMLAQLRFSINRG